MISASKILARGTEDHDEEDLAIVMNMQREGASLFLQLVLSNIFLKKKALRLHEAQLQLRNEGAILIIQSKIDL